MAETLLILGAIGTAGGVSAVVMPGLIKAAVNGDGKVQTGVISAPDGERGVLAMALNEMLSVSHAIIRADEQPDSPFTDIVVWTNDIYEPGVVNESELLLLSHSRIMQTLTAYTLTNATSDLADNEGATDPAIDDYRLVSQGFSSWWKGHQSVSGAIVMADIRSIRVNRTDRTPEGEHWRVLLTWSGDKPDVQSAEAEIFVSLPPANR